MKKNYFTNYLNKFSKIHLNYDNKNFLKIVEILKKIKKDKKKVIIVGNGGSAAIASHVTVDLTKMCKIRAINFNEADLLTCFSNDYGYENWVKKALSSYADKGDLLICISSSGESKNIINGANFAKKIGCKVITLTGFDGKNKVRKIGNINLWLNSKNYNIIEMTHHIWLLSIVDFIAKAKF
ncbi:probable phosphoheptose isomerase, putative [Candidatus Pelagibacter sp. HTCC7211]|uniref:SIS domain-containing protein n=1 Tax=Pelagibacter sp. (strain HTCC7211) TaxID=439493 RepID=UPI000183A8D5|nr:SIS domain-containing protein [Candidatus Pelagibacter sp. HTCC7211]EDZ59994.1 probable phosphoheptose isomerase, putative [Candidatus Pelagibacter sp. HTCC7211]MBD1151164.1 SIS domain-containing protein [Pelagibacterales bacterium SAG-MED25]